MSDSTASYNAIKLQTLGDNGKPPKSRLDSADEAKAIVAKLREAAQERDRNDTKIRGMIDGAPPMSRAKLRVNGQLWRTNVNWLEGKAARSAALVPYYDLFSSVPYFAEVFTGYDALPEDQILWSRIITEEQDYTLKEWTGFDFNMQAMLNDYVTYGKGFLIFKDDVDWQFTHIPHTRVRVPDGTLATLDQSEIVVIHESLAVHKLYNYVRNRDAATTAGWDVSAVLQAIRKATPRTSGSSTDDYDFYAQMVNDHDIYEGIRSPTVQVAHLYVAEFDSSVTHVIVEDPGMMDAVDHEDRISKVRTGKEKADQFLFKKLHVYDNFSQAMATFFLEVLDGSWNGAAGLGKEIYAPMEAKNRLRNTELDLAFMRGSITLRATTPAAMQSAQLVQMGVINVIPPEFEVQQSAVLGDVEGLIAVNRDIEMMISANTGIYRQRMEKPEGNPRTAEEVRLQYMNQVMLGNSAVNRFYCQLDKLYYEVYRRLAKVELSGDSAGVKMAREFRKRCKDRGVPAEAISKCKQVRAYRNIGNGSVYMRQQAISGLIGFLPALPEEGKVQFIQDSIASFTNQTMVDRYYPRTALAKMPTDDMAQAMLENAAIKIGAPVSWTPKQNNVIHLQVHLQSGAQAADSLNQGADPVDVLAYIDGIGAHSAIHLQMLSQDPIRKGDFQALQEQFEELGKFADRLRKQVEQNAQKMAEARAAQAQAQAISSGTDPKTQIKAAETEAKIGMQQRKTDAALEQKAAKSEQSLRLNDAKTASAIALQKRKQDAMDKESVPA